MPHRVDFHSRYSKGKNDPPELPGLPVVELVLAYGKKHFITFGLLDTGSIWTVIGTKYASALGLDYLKAPQIQIIGLGNARCIGYEIDLKLVLRVANYAWESRVAISTAVDAFPFILLGHVGFFDHFDVDFQTRHRHFHIVKP